MCHVAHSGAAGTSPRSQDPQSVWKSGAFPPTTIPQAIFPIHASFPTRPLPSNVTDRAGKEAAGKMLSNLDAASSAQGDATAAASSIQETLAEEAKILKRLYIVVTLYRKPGGR
jgi:hypothetical protein